MTVSNVPLPRTDVSCKLCTIRLEQLCYQRAWWFWAFREVLATGVRLFALVHRVRPDDYKTRSPMCHNCLRFKKNALKLKSPTFRWLDGYINPLFNRVRDSLLTPGELEQARLLARRAEQREFQPTESRCSMDREKKREKKRCQEP